MNKKDYGITKLYRFSNKLYKKGFKIIPTLLKNFIRVCFSATIPYKCTIGYGTKFPHGGQGVVLNENVKIGNNCIISANVVIGGKSGTEVVPVIGDNVIIGANSTIIGNVVIEDNSIIGAGAVVTKNVKKGQVVVGNPAHSIKKGVL